jgi:ankyrin repeat protein
MFDMGGYGSGAHFVLNTALERLNLPLAEWALTHGASPNSASSSNQKPRLDRSLYDIAVMRGLTEFADLLRRHGARSSGVPLGDEDAFFAACMRLDRAAASSLLDRHPEYRRSHRVMFEAAKRDRPDVIELLLDLGVPLEIEDQHGTRALHHAAVNNALRAAQYLLDRGAAIDPRERSWGGAPIGWAGHGDHVQMLDLLSRHSKNVWTLAFRGYVDRLREILAVDPALARQVTDDGITPLWWLPDDDAKAMEIVELLLAAGADPSIRSREGKTASDWARQRGMSDVARRLVEAGSQPPAAVEPPNVPHFEGDGMFPATRPIVQPPSEPADAPIELRTPFTMRLRDNSGVSTTDVWRILVAARDGNLELVKELLAAWPALIRSAYNYMPPLHLAVREGHLDVVRCLAERGAVNPKYRTYPYDEPLVTVATDRGHAEIASVLEEFGPRSDPDRPEDESGHIEYESDWERRRFERLVASNTLRGAQELLGRRPELATDPYAFHCEGILSQPANRRYMKMLDLLMRHGARVPDVSKWAHAYYFKHDDVASLLMERGMNANHMNVHRTTLLHEMARLGELTRATLLLDHGADIDAVDQEFRSTPLGFAARWGQRKMVRLLLDRGADRGRSGAEWAAPLEWARRKGHRTIEADLR